MKKAACRWCGALVSMPDTFDVKDKHKDVLCSPQCMQIEQAFMLQFSDQNIGERNLKDFGVNPNHRGRKK